MMVRPFRTAAITDETIATFFRPNLSMRYVHDIDPTIEPMRTDTDSKEVMTFDSGSNETTCPFFEYILII